VPDVNWLYVALFFLVFPIFSTLSFPLSLIYWSLISDSYQLPFSVALVLLILFTGVIFFIPAGFLQVCKSGNYLTAFNLRGAFS